MIDLPAIAYELLFGSAADTKNRVLRFSINISRNLLEKQLRKEDIEEMRKSKSKALRILSKACKKHKNLERALKNYLILREYLESFSLGSFPHLYTRLEISDIKRREERLDPDVIMHEDKGLICILGPPGAGKTTLCRYFAMNIGQGVYEKHDFPVYIDLGTFQNGDIDLIAYSIRKDF